MIQRDTYFFRRTPMFYQYEMLELKWKGQEPEGSFVEVDLEAVFSQGEEQI
jgi:hypothetical protein